MTIHYGKRNAGSLTAAAPGDTIYVTFATYNDSGASIVDTGFSHADIEIYKNNGNVARATDSGVWLGDSGANNLIAGTRVAASAFSDTGLFGNVKGIYSFGVRLFNTTDDTGFYDAGSSYAVTVQGMSIKSGQGHAEVNFVPATFEITGIRQQGGVNVVAGSVGHPKAMMAGAHNDTGAITLSGGRTLTGLITDAVNSTSLAATGVNEIWASDTGIRQLIARADTGTRGAQLDLQTKLDTGVPASIAAGAVASVTGAVGSVAGNVDGSVASVVGNVGGNVVGTVGTVNAIASGAITATAIAANAIGASELAADAVTEIAVKVKSYADSGTVSDTGVRNAIAELDTGVTGSLNRILAKQDTGTDVTVDLAPVLAKLDTGTLADMVASVLTGTTATTNKLDTGVPAAIAAGAVASVTGAVGSVAGNVDGSVASVAGNVGGSVASVTLISANAIDSGALTGTLASLGSHDTGLRQLVARMDTGIANHVAELDTGVTGSLNRILAKLDTGVDVTVDLTPVTNKLDTGVPASIAAGPVASVTGAVASVSGNVDGSVASVVGAVGSVAGAVASVTLISPNAIDSGALTGTLASLGSHDTGLRQLVARIDTGIRNLILEVDTGISSQLTDISGKIDTGVPASVWQASKSAFVGDTGSLAYAVGDVRLVFGDSGAAANLLHAFVDTGFILVNAEVTLDTGTPINASVDTGAIVNGVWNALRTDHVVAGTFGRDVLDSGKAAAVADTGKIASAVWANHLSRVATALTTVSTNGITAGSIAANAIGAAELADDAVLEIAARVKLYFDTGTHNDTGSRNAIAELDTGVTGSLNRILAKLDTGVDVTVDLTPVTNKLDTGVPASIAAGAVASVTGAVGSVTLISPNAIDSGALTGTLASLGSHDTGLRQLVARFDTGVRNAVLELDTGVTASLNRILAKQDTGTDVTVDLTPVLNKLDTGVPASVWSRSVSAEAADTGSHAYAAGRLLVVHGDTGAAHIEAGRLATRVMAMGTNVLSAAALATDAVTEIAVATAALDTGIRQLITRNDTGSRNAIAELDTGVTGSLNRLIAKVDTGVTANILDTGLRLALARVDTGIRVHMAVYDTGSRNAILELDTGVTGSLNRLIAKVDTGVTANILDTGLRLALARVDTGIRQAIAQLDTGILDTGQISNAVWDSVLTGASHNVATSAGKRLRQAANYIAEESTVNDTGIATPNATTTIFRTNLAEATDEHYRDATIIFLSGALTGQARIILSYSGLNKEVTLDEPLTDIPADGDDLTIMADHVHAVTTISSAVWDEEDTGHAGSAGTMGAALLAIDTGVPANVHALDTGIRLQITRNDTGSRNAILELDTGVTASLNRIIAKVDTGVTATVDLTPVTNKLDTGTLADMVASVLTGTTAVTNKLDTGDIPVDILKVGGSTAARVDLTNWLAKLSDSGTFDTGTIPMWAFLRSKVDTGYAGELAVLLSKIDTGVTAHIVDTGLYQLINRMDTGLGADNALTRTWISDVDTGIRQALTRLSTKVDTGVGAHVKALLDTGLVTADVQLIDGDTGAALALKEFANLITVTGQIQAAGIADGALTNAKKGADWDTGQENVIAVHDAKIAAKIDTGVEATLALDTGQMNQAVWQNDAQRTLTSMDFDTGQRLALARHDTGVDHVLDRILAKVDTGVTATVNLTPVLAKLDTGVPGSITSGPGAYLVDAPLSAKLDTGVPSSIWAFVAEAGRTLTSFAFNVDTGAKERIARADTGIQSGVTRILAKLDTGVDVDLTPVTNKLDTGWVFANIRAVNSAVVQGTGDTGTNDPWRPV